MYKRFLRNGSITFIIVAMLALAGWLSLPQFSQVASAGLDDSSYKLVWQDEFDGNSLNTDNWGYQTGGWGASGIQNCYKSGADNVAVSGGTLKITAQYVPGVSCSGGTRDFTSGFVQTKDKKTWTYGYFEARMKMPTNNGSTWPALWMSPNEARYGSWPASGEIDIIEAKGHDPTYVAGNAHWGTSSKRNQKPGVTRQVNTGDWHVYAVKWQEGKLEFFVDGELYHVIDNFHGPSATTHPGPFNIPFYIRINMAIGGSYLDPPHNDANNNIANFPATMEVDYVRVYQKVTNSGNSGDSDSGGGSGSTGSTSNQSNETAQAVQPSTGGSSGGGSSGSSSSNSSGSTNQGGSNVDDSSSSSSSSDNSTGSQPKSSDSDTNSPYAVSSHTGTSSDSTLESSNTQNGWLIWAGVGAGAVVLAVLAWLIWRKLKKAN